MVAELARNVQQDLQEVWSEAQTITDVAEVINVIRDVVARVELRSLEFRDITGEEKKEVAVKVINAFVDIPLCPEWLEGKVISYVIDTIVNTLNRYVGKMWGSLVEE